MRTLDKAQAVLTLAALLALLALLLAACGTRPADVSQAAEKAPTTVRLGTVTTGEIRSMLNYTGDFNPKFVVNVLPKVAGRIVKLNVDLGATVAKDQVIAEIEHTQLDVQMAQARANLQAAQAKLATVNAQGRPEQVAQAQAQLDAAKEKVGALETGRPESVGQAQAQLDAAKAKLQQLLNGATPAQVQQAKLAVEQAKDKLFADQTTYDAQVARGQMTKEMRESALDADQTAIDQANAAVKVLIDPPTADQVNQAKAAVDQAQHALDAAQRPGSDQDLAQANAGVRAAEAALVLAGKPYTAQDAQAAAAGVAQAQAAIDLVQTQIDDTKVTAPVEGVVARKLVNEGDTVSTGSPLVAIASSQWEVAVQVAEQAIGQVRLGEPVRMTAAAFPDKPFNGVISSIAPLIDSQTRTFTVKAEPRGDTPDVRGGMSTRIDIPAAVHTNVALLPKGALVLKNGQEVAFTVQEGRAHAAPVKTGIADDRNVEILAGLQPGDSVVVVGQNLLEDRDPVTVEAS